ncbi:hypothetical protein EXT57_00920 [Pectobacterium brasiliense]|uniref:hypothetical protein n=1 Tax=Pectobacterium brasiliense TaxID=180957 RepID=UPI00202D4227|nr:hypothetical protein [Pectobacterium brasiliense]MCL6375937.1 hypothetical protein [Pectobacterium brasiliense]
MNKVRADLHLLDGFIAHNPDLGDRFLDMLANCRDELLELRKQSPNSDQQALGHVGNQSVGCFINRYELSGDNETLTLTLHHTLDGQVLDQDVTLTAHCGRWQAVIALDEFPDMETPAGALFKLSDWLMRLGLAARIDAVTEQRLEALTE